MPATFIENVRARLIRVRTLRIALFALIAAAAAALAWGLAWRCFGYAAPRLAYAVIAAVAVTTFLVAIFFRRPDTHHAAARADRYFGLKDALVSFLEFARRPDHSHPIYQFQHAATADAVAGLSPAAMPSGISRRSVWLAAILIVAAVGLALLPHSAAVAAKLRAEEETLAKSALVAEELRAAVEEIIDSMDENEREQLKPELLRSWVKELEPTTDQRDLMKAVARFEQKIAAAASGLESRKDAEILKLAAAELDASQLTDAKQLATKLDDKDYQAARQQLGDLKPVKADPANPGDIAKMQKTSAKMKEVARRMANGARKRDFGKASRTANPDPNAKEMDQLLDDLDKAADAADKNPGELGELDKNLQQLGARLGKLDGQEKAKARLKALGKCASDANSFATGRSQGLELAQQMAKVGGLPPGTGHMDAKRGERDEARGNNQMAQLQGQRSDGESQSSVESAESGTGISGRSQSARERDFRKQTESLVHRDDVPEELKQGIREYFERINQTPPPADNK